MNRFLAILLALGTIALFAASNIFDIWMIPKCSVFLLIASISFKALSIACIGVYSLFAASHAVQHLESPKDRVGWMIITLGFNVLGSCIYYCTLYQKFRKEGKGGLIRDH